MRRLVAGDGPVIALGILCGVAASFGSWLPLVPLAGLVVVWAMLQWPSVATGLVFVGILAAERGLTSFSVAGLPITISKVMVLLATGVHLARVGVLRRPLYEPTPITGSMALVVLSMIFSAVHAVEPEQAYEPTASVVMLIFMTHLLYTMTPRAELPWLVRFMAVAEILIIVWTLFTQRDQDLYMSLDHAWAQRTSGAFRDPNFWGACLIVVTPMILTALAWEEHWLDTPLLITLLALFPLAILQSMSRAALVGLLPIVPGLLFALRHRRGLLLAGVGLAIVILPMVVNLDSILLRYQTLVDPTLEASLGHGSLSERKALLDAGIKIIEQHWLLGVGVGMFQMYAAYVTAGEVWKIAHNSYLNIFAEQGLPGVVVHAYFVFRLVRAAWGTWVAPRDPKARSIGLGFLLGLLGFAIMAATLNLIAFSMFWYTVALGLAFGRDAEQTATAKAEEPTTTTLAEAVA
jgi:O-antigen ligase